jgi:hypothetical protein
MSLLKDRQILYKKYNKLTFDDFEKTSILGEGVQGKVYKYCSNKKECIAIKKVYLDTTQSKYVAPHKINTKAALKNTLFIELFVNKLTNKLLLENASPHFVFFYSNEFQEREGICYEEYPYASYFYNEYIDNSETLGKWIKNKSKNILYNAFFQIVVALYTAQKHFGLLHLDLHSDNILVKKVKKGGYFKYIINNTEYFVPNLGFLVVINDYGFAWIPKNKNKDTHYDIEFILNDIKNYCPVSLKTDIKYIINNLKKNVSFEDLINDVWGNMYNKKNANSKVLETYYPDKTIKLDKKIKDIIKIGINN